MAASRDSERFLEEALSGIPRVAKAIADIPTALQQRALEAAERSYRQTVRNLTLRFLLARLCFEFAANLHSMKLMMELDPIVSFHDGS